MKRLLMLVTILLMSMSAFAIEDGTYQYERNSGNVGNILGESSIVLEKNQELTFISVPGGVGSKYVDIKIIAMDQNGVMTESSQNILIYLQSSGSPYYPYPKEAKTLTGPIEITAMQTSNNGQVIFRVSTIKDEPKFSVSLDNDGDRLAVGYKEDGTNATIRVYEFDGSQWDQLGSDIE